MKPSFLFFLLVPLTIFSQQKKIDSLLNILENSAPDSAKVKLILNISRQYSNAENYGKCIELAQAGLKLAEQLNYKKGSSALLNTIAVAYKSIGDYNKAFEYYNLSLRLKKEINDKPGIGRELGNIGQLHYFQGNYTVALNFMLQGLRIEEELKDSSGMASTFSNIGNVHYMMGKYDAALTNYKMALSIQQNQGDKLGIAFAAGNIGMLYATIKKYEEAEQNILFALRLFKEAGEDYEAANCLINLGNIYGENGDAANALIQFETALKLKKEMGDQYGESACLVNIGVEQTNLKQFSEAQRSLSAAVDLSRKIGMLDNVKEAYLAFSGLYEKMNNPSKALYYYKSFSAVKDSLVNEENSKAMATINAQFQTEKKDNAIRLLNAENEKQKAVSAAERKKQLIILLSVVSGLLLTLAFAIAVFRTYRQKQKANRLLEQKNSLIEKQKDEVDYAYRKLHEKNQEVMDSIHYARRIQRALITSDYYISKTLRRLTSRKQ